MVHNLKRHNIGFPRQFGVCVPLTIFVRTFTVILELKTHSAEVKSRFVHVR